MSRTIDVAAAFVEESEILVTTALGLGECRRLDDWEGFKGRLAALDIDPETARSYWDNMIPAKSRRNGEWQIATTNTSLAHALGIELDSSGPHPRCAMIYELAGRHLPDILRVRVHGTTHMGGEKSRGNPEGRRLVEFERGARSLNGDLMPVYQLFQGKQPSQFSAQVLRAAGSLCEELGTDVGLRLAEVLFNAKVMIPGYPMTRLLGKVIKAGMEGARVSIVGAFCPDYSYEPTGDPHVPWRYTFESVGDGVGLVALQFARIVPALSQLFTELGIGHSITLGIGDFEADSQTVLDGVGLTREEFVARCERSLRAFRNQVPDSVPMTLELCGAERSRGRLRPYAEEATRRLLEGDTGLMSVANLDPSAIIRRIPDQYGTFYERWYPGISVKEMLRKVLVQGGEYAALARIYDEDLGPNSLILAGDRPEMHCFNSFYVSPPTLCAKRAY